MTAAHFHITYDQDNNVNATLGPLTQIWAHSGADRAEQITVRWGCSRLDQSRSDALAMAYGILREAKVPNVYLPATGACSGAVADVEEPL